MRSWMQGEARPSVGSSARIAGGGDQLVAFDRHAAQVELDQQLVEQIQRLGIDLVAADPTPAIEMGGV
jgi:hypothetical protein